MPKLLLNELDHAIRQSHGVTAYRQALEGVSEEVRQKIVKAYSGVADAGNRTALVRDETNARYAEDILSNKHTLERLVQAEPTLKERILSFFKGASADYADTPKLSGAAKKYYRTYKKLFDSFAEANYQGNAYNVAKKGDQTNSYAFRGYSEDGKGIYESNFPVGTPKSAKSEKILDYIRNVWSKKPIQLVISNGETSRTILAQFDPTIDESKNTPTDASKLVGGNRHGNHTEQRVTLDLADDYYKIASESTYNYSKLETGKDLSTHDDVKTWHYFVNDIYFAEYGSEQLTPYTVTINVKEKITEILFTALVQRKSPPPVGLYMPP